MDYLPNWPPNITPLIAFGMMLIAGSIGGYVAHRLSWLPSITGFMAVGFLCGPSGLGLLSQETISNSRIFVDIALALILYRLGLSLDVKHIMHTPRLLFTSLVESTLTFILVFSALYIFEIPPIVATLVATISISSSPAVLLHVSHEVGAEGEVTESTKTLVALNNLISFAAFSVSLPLVHYADGADWATIIIQPMFRLVGSVLLGALVAYCLHEIGIRTHQATQYKLALVIGTVMVAIGFATEFKLSTLCVPLVVGVVVKSLEKESVVSDLAFGPSFELFFIILFVFAGAGLHLHELIEFLPAVLAVVFVRSLAKITGVTAMAKVTGGPIRAGVSGGLLLVPMAGLAIGLVQTSKQLFPAHATVVSAIVLGAVTVFETMGPPIAAFAFRFAGETKEARLRNAAAIIPLNPELNPEVPPEVEEAPTEDIPIEDVLPKGQTEA